ncbi:unnamed protein product [Prunus armeniaca]
MTLWGFEPKTYDLQWIGGGGRAGSLEDGMLRDWRALSWFGSKELEDVVYEVVGVEFGGVEKEVRDGVGGGKGRSRGGEGGGDKEVENRVGSNVGVGLKMGLKWG